ncbi:hypothetical protein Tco_0665064 [Tanacetum coccineum]
MFLLSTYNSSGIPSHRMQVFWSCYHEVQPQIPFVSPPDGLNSVMDFVNELGYPEEIHFVSKMHANLNNPTKKSTPHVIPYCRFTKLIIYYLGSRHNIHKRPESTIHVTGDDFLLGNLKFVPKGEKDEVFGKLIPNVLITDAIRNSEYYQQYMEMVARKPMAKEGGQKKTAPEADKPKKVYTCQETLVYEPDEEPQSAPEPQIEDDEYNLQRGVTRSLPVVEGKGKGISTDEQVAQSLLELQKPKEKSTTDQYIFQRRAPVTEEASTGPSKKGEDVSNTVALEERTVKLDEDQVGSVNTLESRPSPDEDQARPNPGQSHVALAGPNPEPMHEDFIAMNPPSSSGTLSSMKNLDDAFTYGDQFLYNKPTEEEPNKANVETKVKSMVSVPIHQASSTAPPLSTLVIDLTQPKPVSPPIQEPIFTATTATTTTTFPPPPPTQQQSTTYPALAARVSALEQICANLAKKNKQQD